MDSNSPGCQLLPSSPPVLSAIFWLSMPPQVSTTFHNRRITYATTEEFENMYFKYIPLEDVEELEQYCPGGYHPISINDTLHNRYRIINNLSYGGYSTVWLTKDKKTSSYVAVKVSTAENNNLQEYSILRQLGFPNLKGGHPDQETIPRY